MADKSDRDRMLDVLTLARKMVDGANGDLPEVRRAIITGLTALNGTRTADVQTVPRPIYELLADHIALLERRQNGERWAIQSGLPWLDRMTGGWRRGQLVVVGGRSSAGKSILGLQFARIAADRNYRVLYILLEMTVEQSLDRILAAVAGVDFRKIEDGRLGDTDWQRVVDAVQRLMETRPHLMIDERCPMTLEAIQQTARLAAQSGVDMIVVDYIGEVAQSNARQSRYDHVSDVVRGLKSLALELHVPVLALSQLNGGAGTERPRLEHLRESGEVGNNADIVLMIHRPPTDGPPTVVTEMELGLVKQRNGPCGWSKFELVGAEMHVRERLTTDTWVEG